MFRRTAIIGGGAAAATVLSELLDRESSPALQLDWFTGGAAMARGVAYSTSSPRHLLNVRAASMSMFAGKPRGFLDFVQRADPTITGTDFLPRHRYGDYLDAEVTGALERGRARGHHVNIIPFAADALVPETGGVTVVHGDSSHRVDAAVLAIGALPSQPLSGVSAAALASGRYVVDPWAWLARADGLQQAPGNVVLVGMGLTAVDVILDLSERWPQARFTAFSRHGHFPEAHLPTVAWPADDGAELVEAMREVPELTRWMRLLRETIDQPGSEWRAVVDGLRPYLPGLWSDLPPEQRARFLRHARWAWERVRHRMSPMASEAIVELVRSGRLQCRRARLHAVEVDDAALQLTVARAGEQSTLPADLVIQTIGLDTDVLRSEHRLIRQLLTNAHIEADPLGLGVRADQHGRLLHEDQTWPNLFAIGSLLRGTLWESTAMPEIRQQARQLADRLLND